MPVPSAIADLSTTPGSNSPNGFVDGPGVLDDHQRTAYAFIRQLSDAQVALTGNQTIAGTKTFSSNIVGNLTGNASTATALAGTLAIANGGTGQTTAALAFAALKQAGSETSSGVFELSTDAEAQAFTADKVIDGAKLNTAFKGANQSLGTSGYQKLPGGVIIQWGRLTLTTNGQTFTLPIAFPNTFAVVVPVQVNAGGPVLSASNVVSANITSLSQFTIATNIASSLYYVAIGY